MRKLEFNDRILKDGFPAGWYVQDRLDSGEALLCKETWSFPGNTCICLRPRAIETDRWLPTARKIAASFDKEPAQPTLADALAVREVAALVEALTLAANRLHRCAVDYPTGSREFIQTCEWADEARAALAALTTTLADGDRP